MKGDDHETNLNNGYTRRGFMQFIGISAGMMGASLLSPPSGRVVSAQEVDRIYPVSEMTKVRFTVNGIGYSVLVEPRWSLLYVLREIIGMTGTKIGCDRGECGACTVLIDDVPRYSCLTLAVEAENHAVTTVEGLMDGERLGPVQTAFAEADAFQCGYCTPGQIMAVEGLLRKTQSPTPEEVRVGCSGNLCRCGAYRNIFAAAGNAAQLKNNTGLAKR
ncbi:MAG: (2Fe-2S)-binding protein [Desulfobulbaceae bacterium]|nr:(2Fe-2S)-binding protein [Desulfobulbaceae bacterium]